MSEPVVPSPTFMSLIKNIFLGCLTRRRDAPPSGPPPNPRTSSVNIIPLPSADTQDQDGGGDDSSCHIDEARQMHDSAQRLGNKTRGAVRVAESSSTWEAAGTTVALFNDVVSGLRTFSNIIDSVSDIHPYMRAATVAITAIVKPIVNQDSRDDAFERVLEEMVDTYTLIKKQFDPSTLPLTSSQDQSDLLVKMFELSEACAHFIKDEYAARNFWARAAKNTLRGGDIDAKLERFSVSFSKLREKWRDATLGYLAVQHILDQLKPSPTGGYNSQKACLPETRVELLRQISERIRTGSSRPVVVLGVAGSGKSSIAHSTASDFKDTGELGCFFQFDRSERDRTAPRLIPAIAHALAVLDQGYRTAVVRLLQAIPSLATTNDVNEQWSQLIQQAGASLNPAKTRLLVVDAFDECPEDDFSTRERLLELLTSGELPANIRVLVTSRPLHGVSEAIASAAPCIDMASMPANDDIRRYVRHRFLRAGSNRTSLNEAECDLLADAADGLFQWAATACRFLTTHLGGTSVHEKFEENRKRGTLGREPGREPLDSLYTTVLSDAFDFRDNIAMCRYRSVVAMMLSTTSPLPKAALDVFYRLAGIDPAGSTQGSIVETVLDELGAVITGTNISDVQLPVRPMHTSFRDFLVDRERSDVWHIAPDDIVHGHLLLALGGLRHQAQSLAFNMCGLPSSCTPNAEIPDIREQLDSKLPAGLEYSACFWDLHVATVLELEPKSEAGTRHATNPMEAIRDSLTIILLERFLFWLELLSLCGRVEHAIRSLSIALKVFTKDDAADMREFITDATTFTRHFCSVMSRSAAHVYVSALPFTPESSLIRRHFLPSFPRLPIPQPRLSFWPIAIDRISFGTGYAADWVYCVMCTPDQRLIAGGKYGTVRISNMENAHAPVSYLPGMSPEPGGDKFPAVRAIAYSEKHHAISVGYANGVIGLWDSVTRQLRTVMNPTSW